MILYWTINFVKSLNRDNSNTQCGFAIAFGLLLGVIPCLTLHWFLILALVLILRVNLAVTFFSSIAFAVPAVLFENWFSRLGFWCLHGLTGLTPLWARLYHAPLFPFTRFNYSQVMGATVFAFAFFLPTALLGRWLIKKYRQDLHTFWLSTRINRSYAHFRRFSA